MDDQLKWCNWSFDTTGNVQKIVVGVVTLFQSAFVVSAIWWARKQARLAKERAEKGGLDREDNTPLVFPVYIYLLWLCAATEMLEGIIHLAAPYSIKKENKMSTSMANAFSFFFTNFLTESLAFLLLGQGAGVRAIIRAVLPATLWAGITFIMKYTVFRHAGQNMASVVDICWCATLAFFYLTCLANASRWRCACVLARPALRVYSLFFFIVYIGYTISALLRATHYNAGYCMYSLSSGLALVGGPPVLFVTLRQDSKFWQGLLNHDQDYNMEDGMPIQTPMQGIALPPSVTKELATSMDELTVPLLNHAFLTVDYAKEIGDTGNPRSDKGEVRSCLPCCGQREAPTERGGKLPKKLGGGSNAMVYQGTYRGTPCAIKMLYSPELTPDLVRNLCREGFMLGRLKSPRVVGIFGVCVLPPSVCLVMELCSGGSLSQEIRNPDMRTDWAKQLRLALECAEAVAFLHSQTPPILHLDIKSPNFLLTKYGQVKIADLELSRRAHASTAPSFYGGSTVGPSGASAGVYSAVPTSSMAGASGSMASLPIPDTPNWTAPELLAGHSYNEKADVYSLCCVLWEIATGLVPYEEFTLSPAPPVPALSPSPQHTRRTIPKRGTKRSGGMELDETSSLLGANHSQANAQSQRQSLLTAPQQQNGLPSSASASRGSGVFSGSLGSPTSPGTTNLLSSMPPSATPAPPRKSLGGILGAVGGGGGALGGGSAANRGGQRDQELKQRIIDQTYRPPLPATIHPALASIIDKGWSSDPRQRPTSKEIVQSLLALKETVQADSDRMRSFARKTSDPAYFPVAKQDDFSEDEEDSLG